jgi:PAS domain S-box-containing protein
MIQSFGPGIAATQARLESLHKRRGNGASSQQIEEAITELGATLEELRVADEELRAQNEELARARAEAEAIARRYEDLFELVPAGYVITNSAGDISQINRGAADMLGRTPDHCIGKPLSVYVHQVHQKEFRDRMSECVAKAVHEEWESWLLPATNAPFLVVDITAVPSLDARGQVTAIRWLLQDRTAQRHAEAEAKRLEDSLWLRVADRTAVLTGEREALRSEVERLRQRVKDLEAQFGAGANT